MIRKAIIVVLTLGAVGTALLWAGSCSVYKWRYEAFPLKGGGRLNAWGIPGTATFGVWEPVEDPAGDWAMHHS